MRLIPEVCCSQCSIPLPEFEAALKGLALCVEGLADDYATSDEEILLGKLKGLIIAVFPLLRGGVMSNESPGETLAAVLYLGVVSLRIIRRDTRVLDGLFSPVLNGFITLPQNRSNPDGSPIPDEPFNIFKWICYYLEKADEESLTPSVKALKTEYLKEYEYIKSYAIYQPINEPVVKNGQLIPCEEALDQRLLLWSKALVSMYQANVITHRWTINPLICPKCKTPNM